MFLSETERSFLMLVDLNSWEAFWVALHQTHSPFAAMERSFAGRTRPNKGRVGIRVRRGCPTPMAINNKRDDRFFETSTFFERQAPVLSQGAPFEQWAS